MVGIQAKIRAGRVALEGAAFAALAGLTVWSAIAAKGAGQGAPTLAALGGEGGVSGQVERVGDTADGADRADGFVDEAWGLDDELDLVLAEPAADAGGDSAGEPITRWFDGRPIRPARTMRMRVTAYSPDEQSCGPYADGRTATLHCVTTNGGKLVAADIGLLPYGSMLSIPGYDGGNVVPVLDRGGAIKGHRLDVLFPTHEEAMRWGVQNLDVVVWEYADGEPAVSPRRLR
jgi:3D (Asp-Asp-Asp) domain-containing protein